LVAYDNVPYGRLCSFFLILGLHEKLFLKCGL
jgi:hypothetical protein